MFRLGGLTSPPFFLSGLHPTPAPARWICCFTPPQVAMGQKCGDPKMAQALVHGAKDSNLAVSGGLILTPQAYGHGLNLESSWVQFASAPQVLQLLQFVGSRDQHHPSYKPCGVSLYALPSIFGTRMCAGATVVVKL